MADIGDRPADRTVGREVNSIKRCSAVDSTEKHSIVDSTTQRSTAYSTEQCSTLQYKKGQNSWQYRTGKTISKQYRVVQYRYSTEQSSTILSQDRQEGVRFEWWLREWWVAEGDLAEGQPPRHVYSFGDWLMDLKACNILNWFTWAFASKQGILDIKFFRNSPKGGGDEGYWGQECPNKRPVHGRAIKVRKSTRNCPSTYKFLERKTGLVVTVEVHYKCSKEQNGKGLTSLQLEFLYYYSNYLHWYLLIVLIIICKVQLFSSIEKDIPQQYHLKHIM